jgi:hypothetical protein
MASGRHLPCLDSDLGGRGAALVPSQSADLIGNGIFAALALILLVVAWRRSVETVRERSMVDATISRDKFIDS